MFFPNVRIKIENRWVLAVKLQVLCTHTCVGPQETWAFGPRQLAAQATQTRAIPNQRNLTEIPVGRTCPSCTRATEGRRCVYFVAASA